MGARLTLGCGWVVWGVVVLALGLSGRHPRPANNLKRLSPLLARGTDGKAPLSRGDKLDQTLAHLLDLRRREIMLVVIEPRNIRQISHRERLSCATPLLMPVVVHPLVPAIRTAAARWRRLAISAALRKQTNCGRCNRVRTIRSQN